MDINEVRLETLGLEEYVDIQPKGEELLPPQEEPIRLEERLRRWVDAIDR